MLSRSKLLSIALSKYTIRPLFTSEAALKRNNPKYNKEPRKKVQEKKEVLPVFPQEVTEDGPEPDMPNPFTREKKTCILCKMNIVPDYKNVKLLSQFQSPFTGRVYGRHVTGLCKLQQERVEAEIVKAQHAAFMPTYLKSVEFLKDPKLFDPNKPIRPHPF
ncbi:small ribosomal subunit protein bS18m-like [Arctopsyche grandis]|uniref:small ribosomal subunit protein bS18m-like n=1 Tax=Arctopsyche grandis TaxID=121162 RepID=UPI00406D7FCB